MQLDQYILKIQLSICNEYSSVLIYSEKHILLARPMECRQIYFRKLLNTFIRGTSSIYKLIYPEVENACISII